MLFNDITIVRIADYKEMQTIKTGDSAYLYEAPYDILRAVDKKNSKC